MNILENPLFCDCKKVLLTKEELEAIVDRLAAEIEAYYKDSDKQLVAVIILKGSMPFSADLIRKIKLPLQVEVMKVSSYGAGTKSSGEIKVSLDLNREDLPDCDLLIIDDLGKDIPTKWGLSRLFEIIAYTLSNSMCSAGHNGDFTF